jgi:hypothetical protein
LASAPRQLGRVAIAQAEYYCATSKADQLGECMWRMDWRARLRRVRMPERKPEETGARELPDADAAPDPADASALSIGEPMVDLNTACSSLGEPSCELFHSPLDVLH